ncbi:glycosyltransferase family 4 protein [Vibrio splendidus]|uniref:glycosyltransferase family 4 protein n=1 Tax=Vibrio splendidus TaxID=29497 RepID=UPI00076ADA6B|nr:glycosyltransferase family 4 protein [Vibrio splendidus]
MKVTVLGTRGIPDVLGGVETHCQHLYPLIVKQGFEVEVIARSPYVAYKTRSYKGVETKALWAPKKTSLEAIVHSTIAAFSTLTDGSDVVHVHAIGPGLVVPLLRLIGKKVVFTHHGPDYQREKWGRLAKIVLKLGERFAVKYANEVIVISEVINDLIKQSYQRDDAHLIYNGVNPAKPLPVDVVSSILERYQLTARGYIVAVGRFVEEKGFHDLLQAYAKSKLDMPLVLIGDSDHESEYSHSLKQAANDTPGVILTGFLKGEELQVVFSQAKLFVMPSYHEGLPIALLEAMSYSLPVVVSDIAPNSAVGLEPDGYFPVKDIDELSLAIQKRCVVPLQDYQHFLERYDWHKIADQTVGVYNKMLGSKRDESS